MDTDVYFTPSCPGYGLVAYCDPDRVGPHPATLRVPGHDSMLRRVGRLFRVAEPSIVGLHDRLAAA